MTLPTKRMADQPLTGEEMMLVIQNGRIRRAETSDLLDLIYHRRVEKISGSSGQKILFSKPFSKPPLVIPLDGWQGVQLIIPTVGTVSNDGVVLNAKRSRSTLLLNNSPFEDAPANTPVSAIVIENL